MLKHALAVLAIGGLVVGEGTAAEPVDFTKQIEPIFAAHCVKCHGQAKAQAGLDLESVAGIEAKLSKKPQLLVAGKPDESLLYQRLILPSDSPKRMPKGGDPLGKDELGLIEEWIEQGAELPTSKAEVTGTPPTAEKPAAEKPALPEVPPAPAAAIEKLRAAGARVSPLYADSNLLDISFAGRGEPAGDVEVALAGAVAEQVYMLNLADAKLSAAGLAPLAAMHHLAWLHLERATIDDDALAPMKDLKELEYLNLYGTPITDAGLKHLSGLPRLAKLYLWQTKVSYDGATELEKSIPGLVFNLGYDHPVVVRKRLTRQRDEAKQHLAEATKEVEKLQHQLDQSKQDVETTKAQLDQVENELKAATSDAKP